MAYSDNYPNGHKSGYSSADDPDRIDYSPYGVEHAQRNAMFESAERERRMSDYNDGLDRERKNREKREAERARETYAMEQAEKKSIERVEKRCYTLYVKI